MPTNDNHSGRREPTLGDLDNLDQPLAPHPEPDDDLPRIRMPAREAPPGSASGTVRHRSPHRSPSTWRAWLWPLLAIVLVALLAWAWVNQDRLRDMLPRTQLNTTLMHADQALADGHLDGDDGSSARELYAQVLQQEPDNGDAIKGMHAVGQAELAAASSAVDAGHFDVARGSLKRARDILGGGADVERVQDALRKAEHPVKQLHASLEKARAQLEAGHVAGPDGAAALYHQVLKVEPDNDVARHGLAQAGDALASRARDALRNGDTDRADQLVSTLGKLLPRYSDLPSLHARLSQARQASAAAVDQTLSQAHKDLQRGRFTGHGDDNALAGFQAVLKADPDNAEARAGIEQVARALVLRANAAIDGDDRAQARELIDQAQKLAPSLDEVKAARARLAASPDAAVAQAGSAGDVAAARPPLDELQKVEVRHLVQRADAAVAAGHIMLPPGKSAYDLYREALTIDANDKAARAGLAGLPDRVVGHFNQALAAHRLSRADDYLATLRSLDNGGARADAMAAKLADAWLDHADISLGQGNRMAAIQAIESARKLEPDSARARDLARRVQSDAH